MIYLTNAPKETRHIMLQHRQRRIQIFQNANNRVVFFNRLLCLVQCLLRIERPTNGWDGMGWESKKLHILKMMEKSIKPLLSARIGLCFMDRQTHIGGCAFTLASALALFNGFFSREKYYVDFTSEVFSFLLHYLDDSRRN